MASPRNAASQSGFFSDEQKVPPLRMHAIPKTVVMDRITEINSKFRQEALQRIATQIHSTVDEIKQTECFETAVIRLIQRLNPAEVSSFLTESTDVSGKASANVDAIFMTITYKSFSNEQHIMLAKVLGQYFKGLEASVTPIEDSDRYEITLNSKVFLKSVLPYLNSKEMPAKLDNPEEPVLSRKMDDMFSRYMDLVDMKALFAEADKAQQERASFRPQ